MDNADLEKLRVSPGKLAPKFKASVTEYSVTVASSVSELKLTVLTSDSGASYSIKVSCHAFNARDFTRPFSRAVMVVGRL